MDIRLEKTFKGHNLVIRTATAEDAPVLVKWWNDGKVMKHAGFPFGLGTNEEKVINDSIGKISKDRQLLIIEYDNNKIGEMSYRREGETTDFGIKICEDSYQESGIGTTLLNMLFEHLFYTCMCTKITCDTNLNNVRAQHVYENKMHMEKVKISYDCWKNQIGEIQSTVFFELTKENYEKNREICKC